MGILVIEDGRPCGDLVVRDARLNPIARANSEPQKHVRAIDIGEGFAVLGIGLEPTMTAGSDEEPAFCAILTVVGGKQSDLVPMVPVKLILGEVGRIPISKLREMFSRAIDGKSDEVQA